MTASNVSKTLELVMTAPGCRNVPLRQRPPLLSDNVPGFFISDAFAQWLMRAMVGLPAAVERIVMI